MSLHFKTVAKITNTKPRLEGSKSEDTQHRALDLRVSGSLPGDALAALAGVDTDDAAGFWLPSTDGPLPKFRGLTVIKSKAVFDNCNLKIGAAKYQAAQVRAFQFEIEPDSALKATFTIRLYDLNDATVGRLLKLYQQLVDIEVESAQQDIFEGADDE